jgi:hypothetical protein
MRITWRLCCYLVSSAVEVTPVGFEPTTYALQVHRAQTSTTPPQTASCLPAVAEPRADQHAMSDQSEPAERRRLLLCARDFSGTFSPV